MRKPTGRRAVAAALAILGSQGLLAAGFGAAYVAGLPRMIDDWREKAWRLAAIASLALTALSFVMWFLWFSRIFSKLPLR